MEGDVNQIRKLAPQKYFVTTLAGRENENTKKKWADPLLMKTPGTRGEREGDVLCVLFWGFLTNLKVKYIPNRESSRSD